MLRPTASWLIFAATLGGCASSSAQSPLDPLMPGYVPSTPKREKMLAAAPKGGGFNSDGTYFMTEQEQKLDCKQLSGSITIKILQMRADSGRAVASDMAKNAQTAVNKVKGGSTYALDNAVDYKRDRARLETLNGRLAEKNCRTFNLEAELAPGNTAQPAPVGEAPKAPSKKAKQG